MIPNKKISELTEITSLDNADLIPAVDISEGTTNKITLANFPISPKIQDALDDKADTDQTLYIGTTGINLNRASGTLNLAGIGTLACGAITATSYNGVLAANLLDKSANETINGRYHHNTSYTTDTVLSYTGLQNDFTKRIQGNITDYGVGLRLTNFAYVDSGFTDNGYLQGLTISSIRNYNSGVDDSGTLNGLWGIRVVVSHDNNNPTATPVTNTMYGINIISLLQTGSVGTSYGLKIDNMVGTTQYAIHTGTGTCHFGDDVTVAGDLDLTGTSYTAGDPTTTGYFTIKVDGVNYKVPCVAA